MSTKKTKPRQQRAIVEECTCCHVNFNPNICPQCQVAGCTHKAKGSSCLMRAAVAAARKLTPLQMAEKIADLERTLEQQKETIAELLQRLVHIAEVKAA